jgi:hypothetical protein
MPSSVPSSTNGWWCSPNTEYAFLGFSYEVTACATILSPWIHELIQLQANPQASSKVTLLTSRTLLDRDTSAFTALVIETVSSKALSVPIVPELTSFHLSDDIVNAAWDAGLGVHALIWVRRFKWKWRSCSNSFGAHSLDSMEAISG